MNSATGPARRSGRDRRGKRVAMSLLTTDPPHLRPKKHSGLLSVSVGEVEQVTRHPPRVRLRVEQDEQARAAFLTLVLTGLRRSELQRLRWRDVDLLGGVIRVRESKSEEG